MKPMCQIFVVFTLALMTTVAATSKNVAARNAFASSVGEKNNLMLGACTIFSISCDGLVFMGNNEDWKNPSTYYWVKPAEEGEYGVLYFGFDDFGPQGGVNEKGLAFDGNALPYVPIKSHPEKLKASEAIVNNIIMKKCATVEEAIRMAASYDWGHLYSGKFAGQYLLADATGEAVVIGFGADGELAFTRKTGTNGYLVSTNFNRAYSENRYGAYPCPRFESATSMLKRINQGEDCTVAYLASILDAVHAEGRTINTVYSNIYDLKNGIVYLYYWHDYRYAKKLHVADLIRSAQPPTPIKDVFPREVIENAAEEYQNYRRYPLQIGLISGWVILVISSEIFLFRKKFGHNLISGKNKGIWVVIILLTGPLGLLYIILASRN